MAFWRNEAFIGIHGSSVSGMLYNHASYTGRIFYLQRSQEGIFLAKARHYIIILSDSLSLSFFHWRWPSQGTEFTGFSRLFNQALLVWVTGLRELESAGRISGFIHDCIFSLGGIDFQYAWPLPYFIHLPASITILNCTACKNTTVLYAYRSLLKIEMKAANCFRNNINLQSHIVTFIVANIYITSYVINLYFWLRTFIDTLSALNEFSRR